MSRRLFINEMARMAGAVLNKKPLRQARNAVKNVADRIALTTPLSRTERDAIAILNPSLGLKPTRTRGEYRQASRINDFNPVSAYKEKRKERIGTALTTGILAGAGAKLYSDAKQRSDAERNRVAREAQAQQNKEYQQRYEANRDYNTRTRQQWQDNAFNRYKLSKPVSGGPAVASALQDVSQKIKNRIYPDRGSYITESGVIMPASSRVSSAMQDPFNPENVYNFNSMMANIPQDSTDEYTMVASSGAGRPVARITATSKRPNVTVNTSLLDTMRNKPDIKNMSLSELQDFAETFNSFMGTQPGNRFQRLEFLNPVKPSSSRGSVTTKRMTKENSNMIRKKSNNTKDSQRNPKYVDLPKSITHRNPPAYVYLPKSPNAVVTPQYTKLPKSTRQRQNPEYIDLPSSSMSRGNPKYIDASKTRNRNPNSERNPEYVRLKKSAIHKADSQRYPAYVRLPKSPTRSSRDYFLALSNRVRSAVDSFIEDPQRMVINAVTPESTKSRRLQADMIDTYRKNAKLYNKIRQGYFDAKNKGYIRGKNLPTK